MPEKPRARERYHHGDLPAALIAAGLELLATEGGDALTIRAVARKVGVDHSAAYRHYEDKRALLAAIAERGFRELVGEVRRSATSGTAEQRLFAAATAYVRFAIDRPALFGLMLGPRLNEDGRFPSLEAAVMEAFDLLRAMIAEGVADGTLDPALRERDAAAGVWSAAHGLAVLALGGRIRVKSVESAVRGVIGPTIRGLAKRA